MDKFFLDIFPIVKASSDDKQAINNFIGVVKNVFGIDSADVSLISGSKDYSEKLDEYIQNTKKVYVDNQLSEYSAFPELINYKNKGYSSFAAIPIIASGKTIALLKLMAKQENRFSDDMLTALSIGGFFIGMFLAYKGESAMNLKIANYFDAAFNSSTPQMLVNSAGQIIKLNKGAISIFSVTSNSKTNFKDILNAPLEKVFALERGKFIDTTISVNGDERTISISSYKINDDMVHISINDSTERNAFIAIASLVNSSKGIYIFITDKELRIRSAIGKFDDMPEGGAYFAGKNLLELVQKSPGKQEADLQKVGKSKSGIADMVIGNAPMHVRYSIKDIGDGYAIVATDAGIEKYSDLLRENLYGFLNATSDAAVTLDELGYIRDCNISLEQVLGYKKDEIIGTDVRSLYVDQAILDRDIAYVKSGGAVDGTYINLQKRNHEIIPGIHSIRGLKGRNGVEYLLLIKELATKRRLEDQESELKAQIALSKRFRMNSELKSQFISDITHELKTPLTNIKGFSKLLYDGDFGKLNDDQKEYMKTILDESDRLMIIITQVLDAAKLEADKVKLDIKETNLREMQNNPSIKALEERARNNGLDFKWESDYDVPIITADPNRLIQVFANLIGNSIKFTEKGSIKVHIFKKSRGKIQCEVYDTGIGISDDDKRGIFKKFYQAQKRGLIKPDGTGTGLGLAITKEIIRLHHGTIKFDSQLGKGTKFWFTLPIAYKPSKKDQES